MESFFTAMDSLRANKMRSVLTMLGVIIGVAAVIALLSIGKGFSAYISQQIQSAGTNWIYVAPDLDASDGAQTLSEADMRALRDPANAPHVTEVTGAVYATRKVVLDKKTKSSTIVGVTPNYFKIGSMTLAQGQLISQADVDSSQRTTVLGHKIAADLFGTANPVGRTIKITGTDYRVIGLLNEKGGSGDNGPDSMVFLPISTMRAHITSIHTRQGGQALNFIIAQATGENDLEVAEREITRTLRKEHQVVYAGQDDFQIITQTQMLSTFNNITGTITLFLGAIAGVSLLVGGIGIMNIMLVSVTERTKEIGLRKAIGALQRDILVQFMIEALMLSLTGGAIGVALGWGIALLLGPAIQITAVMDLGIIGLATGFAAAVGLGFGIYPAWRAARLRPITALRYE